MYGLLERDMVNILKAIKQFDTIESVIIFGSRAMGNYKRGSDVDLVIMGIEVDRKVIRRLSDLLNEVMPLPYFFDVLDYKAIESQALIEHIEKEGKLIYEKKIERI